MNKKDFSFLSKTFLFSGIEANELPDLPCVVNTQTIVCEKGTLINLALAEEKKIGFVLSGQCEVRCDKLVLNVLGKGDSFGILSVFCEEPYPTAIIAKKESRILFLSKASLLSLIQASPKISMNVITFLAGRISFLSKKATMLGSASAEDKLSVFLKEEYRKQGERFPFSATAIAKKINIGRASLYRALTSLEEKEIVLHQENSIFVLRPECL